MPLRVVNDVASMAKKKRLSELLYARTRLKYRCLNSLFMQWKRDCGAAARAKVALSEGVDWRGYCFSDKKATNNFKVCSLCLTALATAPWLPVRPKKRILLME